MAKNLRFSLLFCVFHLISTSIFASKEPSLPENETYRLEQCNAPAPQDFHGTCVSTNFVSLAWTPVWVGATHTLAIFIQSGTGWLPVDTIYNVPGSSYTVDSLLPGSEYKFIIATNCVFGDPSEITTFANVITLILDLAISGRMPIDPVPVDCHNIDFTNHEWVGFGVKEFYSGTMSFFEYETAEDNISNVKIKRSGLNHPIVAVNLIGVWPTISEPSLNGPNPFRIDHILNGGPEAINIGYVVYTRYLTNPPTIDLCRDINNVEQKWLKSYKFSAFTAESAYPHIIPGSEERSISDSNNSKFKAQSPFKESLNIFLPQTCLDYGATIFHLINTKGQTILEYNLKLPTTEVSFSTDIIPSGMYILRIENAHDVQILKVIKSD